MVGKAFATSRSLVRNWESFLELVSARKLHQFMHVHSEIASEPQKEEKEGAPEAYLGRDRGELVGK